MLIYGERVRSARLLRGLGAGAVAEQLGWSAATQTRLESSGSHEIVVEQASKIAEILSIPRSFLSVLPPPEITATELLFRAPVRTTKREKSYLAEYARIAGEVLDWLDSRHRLPPVRVPSLTPATGIEHAAREVRESLGLQPDKPISHLTHRVERAGVCVIVRDAEDAVGALLQLNQEKSDPLFHAALREDHHAYSTRVGELRDRPLIVARAHKSWERTRMTVAHEIGHLVLHSRELPPDAEEQAYNFGAELLAPAGVLRKLLPSIVTLSELVPLKMHFGISLGALIKHVRRSDLITEKRFKTLESQLYRRINSDTGTTWGRQEPGWDSQQSERPKLISAWLERCAGTSKVGLLRAGPFEYVPSDILASMLSGQREVAGSKRPARTERTIEVDESVVINLDARRAR